MEEKKINQMSLANCDLDEVEIVLGDKFELKIKDGKYYAVRNKLQYPKTYEECCKAISTPMKNEIVGHKWKILQAFQKLLICRDAYWKVAGEQMGLGKPWEPDWKEQKVIKYTIQAQEGYTYTYSACSRHNVLSFPTKEMRNAFYENFKDLIEICKELL